MRFSLNRSRRDIEQEMAFQRSMFVSESDDIKEQLKALNELESGRIVSTIIIILFLIHPTVTRIMFNAFK